MKTHPHLPSLCLALALAAPGALAQETPSAKDSQQTAQAVPASSASGLRFNFRGAPLEQVLNYMSDAAGFVIVLDTPVRGTVDMWSSHPVSKEEAVQLLNIALNKNGYALLQEGRNLVISSKEDAKKKNIPVRTGNNPEEIPLTAELVTQIIPLRHIDATQAVKDLSTVLPSSASITANQDSNSLVVTDTQINIRRIVEVAAALDRSIESDSIAKIFRLKNADPTEMADLLNTLYQSNSSSNTNNRTQTQPFSFGGGPGGGPGGFMAAMAAMQGNRRSGNNSSSQNSRGTAQVSAVADPRTFSVIVSASKSTMPQIAEMIAQLDSSPARKQKVYVYTMENANVTEVETVLKNLFPSNTTRSSSSSQTDVLSTRASNNSQATSSSTSSSSSSGLSSR